MTEVTDQILAGPSKSSVELTDIFRELKKYEGITKAPQQLIKEIAERLPQDKVLTVWMLRSFGFGREAKYSIEDTIAAQATHDAHKANYLRNNPVLTRVYSEEDLHFFYQ